MALVDPFTIPLPPKLANDPETGPYFQYTQKFLHDMFQRTGGGTDLVGGSASLTENQTFSGNNTFSATVTVASITISGNVVLQAQGAAVSDASAPGTISGYTPHASGATTVTSNAATDLDTTAAALDTAISELNSLRSTVNSLVSTVNALKDRIEAHGLIAT